MNHHALNRATLVRQLLLGRAEPTVPATAEHLVGPQAQTPRTWYADHWSRLGRPQQAHPGERLVTRGGLTKLGEVLDEMRLPVVVCEDSVELFDLASAPRPTRTRRPRCWWTE